MIIAITSAGTLELKEPNDFKGFKIAVEKIGMTDAQIEAALDGVATMDAAHDHAWKRTDFPRAYPLVFHTDGVAILAHPAVEHHHHGILGAELLHVRDVALSQWIPPEQIMDIFLGGVEVAFARAGVVGKLRGNDAYRPGASHHRVAAPPVAFHGHAVTATKARP